MSAPIEFQTANLTAPTGADKIFSEVGQGIDAFINGAIMDVGNLMQVGVGEVGAGLAGLGAGMQNALAEAKSALSGITGISEGAGQSFSAGLGIAMEKEGPSIGTDEYGLGDMTPDATPAFAGISSGASRFA